MTMMPELPAPGPISPGPAVSILIGLQILNALTVAGRPHGRADDTRNTDDKDTNNESGFTRRALMGA